MSQQALSPRSAEPSRFNDDDWARGHVAAGFEPVANAFAATIRSGAALGAACTIIHRGETVVDLQGGWQDRSRQVAWQGDDIALVYSLTKGVTGMAAAVAVS
ncbi:MAG: serine hydrolase, partial [Qipengyuania citrea]|nr:serine hydrolase [Qipengyuania citrea]